MYNTSFDASIVSTQETQHEHTEHTLGTAHSSTSSCYRSCLLQLLPVTLLCAAATVLLATLHTYEEQQQALAGWAAAGLVAVQLILCI